MAEAIRSWLRHAISGNKYRCRILWNGYRESSDRTWMNTLRVYQEQCNPILFKIEATNPETIVSIVIYCSGAVTYTAYGRDMFGSTSSIIVKASTSLECPEFFDILDRAALATITPN